MTAVHRDTTLHLGWDVGGGDGSRDGVAVLCVTPVPLAAAWEHTLPPQGGFVSRLERAARRG